MTNEEVEWPEPADDPDEEPTEPWAKETNGAETNPDPESELQQ